MKRGLILIAGIFALTACSEVSSESAMDPEALTGALSIPVEFEQMTMESETKAYYVDFGSTGTFQIENGDKVDFYKYSFGTMSGKGTAIVDLGQNSTYFNFLGADLRSGETVYSIIRQKEFSEQLRYFENNENLDPKHLLVSIPSNQTASIEYTSKTETIDCSFTLSKLKTGESEIVKSKDSDYDAVPSNSLSFKIEGYNPDLTYKCSSVPEGLVAETFVIDDEGNATIDVAFPEFSADEKYTKTQLRIYVADYPEFDNSASIEYRASREVGTYYYSYTYALGFVNYSSRLVQVESSSDQQKLIQLRDAMPFVSKSLYLSSSLINAQGNIPGAMTMYFLGSAIQFKIYSTNAQYRDGEKIERVILTSTSGSCAGRYVYDLTSGNLSMSLVPGKGESVIASDVTACNYSVPSSKTAANIVYMVVAPGVHDCLFEVETTNWIHTFMVSGKEYVRANMKSYGMDLNSASAVHTNKNFTPDPVPIFDIGEWVEDDESGYEF